jgi:murein DD-endopeptidase MepM/ murein hydrolase activator NlpD
VTNTYQPTPPDSQPRRCVFVRFIPGARRVWPLPPYPTLALFSLLAAAGVLVCLVGALIAYLQLAPDSKTTTDVDATPSPATIPTEQSDPGIGTTTPFASPTAAIMGTPDALGINQVTLDASGQYAFPVAADPKLYVWTLYHWDGSNAVDIEARFGLSFLDFLQVTAAPLVAMTNGTAVIYSGSVGGSGYMLHGDDGLDYYYAHMSEQWVPDGARVTVGQPLGRIGNTGNSAQFIEPHLHLAIGPRDSLWEQSPTVNGAQFLQTKFGLGWVDRPEAAVAYDRPQGWPVQDPDLTIVTPYDQAPEQGLLQPAIELGFPTGQAPETPLAVIAPLDGVMNVIRWTAYYGTRLQITNDVAQTTVVISGVNDWLVLDGDTVTQGQVIGHWNPANRPVLHYMIFQNGVIIDPTPTLGQSDPAAQAGPDQ